MSGYDDRYSDPLDAAFEAPSSAPAPRDPPYLAGLNKEQREAVEAVDELAVGHGQEQAEHDAEMDRQQRSHRRRVAQHEQGKAGRAGGQQHGQEGHIHALARLVDERAALGRTVGEIKRNGDGAGSGKLAIRPAREAQLIRRLMNDRMYPLTLEGLDAAMRTLTRKQ